MQHESTEVLAERLSRLEAQHRRLKRTMSVAVVAVMSVFLLGQAGRQRTVEATRFVLRDASGRYRGELAVRDNVPGVMLFDTEGKTRVSLKATGRGGSLSTYDRSGRVAALKAEGRDHYLGLWHAGESKAQAWLGLSDKGPELNFVDAGGMKCATLEVGTQSCQLKLYDRKTKRSFTAPRK